MQAQCLCGAVKMDVQHNNQVLACHCGKCRTWSSGGFFALQAEQTPKITGAEYISTFKSSAIAERAFCKQCGSHLYARMVQSDTYHVLAGVLQDNQSELQLATQIFVDCKAPYITLSDDAVKMTEAEFLAFRDGK